MNDLHRKILELLKEIDDICKRYDITYYAAGGTTIGAIRHRGFIPWDDDADIYMTRDNFYKFREAFKKEKPQGRVLGCLDDNPEYPGTIPRYIDDNTSLVAKFHTLNTCEAGVVIDMFILDPVPSEPELIDEHIGKLNIYADMVMPYYGYTNRADDKYLAMYDHYEKRAKEEGRDVVIKELEKDLFTYPEETCEHFVLRWGTLSHVFPKSMFEEPEYFEYEGMEIPCPKRWWDYLVMLYGAKWMYIPSHVEDESHDFIVDLDYKYTNYLIDADRFIPKEEAYDIYQKRKKSFIKREQLTRPLKNEICYSNGKYILLSQAKYLDRENIDIYALTKAGDYKAIVDAYKPYLDMQFSQNFVGKMNHARTYRFRNKIFIPLEDSQLEILMYALFMTGAFKRGKDLIDLRKTTGSLTDDMKLIEERIISIYGLYEAYYIGDLNLVKDFLRRFTVEERNCIADLTKISLSLKVSKKQEPEITFDLIKLAMDKFSGDSEFEKLLGDWYYTNGDIEKARASYENALPKLTNGLMMLDIKDKFQDIQLNYDTPIDISKKTVLQDKQFDLLKEIDEICAANDIDYALSGKTLLFGYFKHIFKDQYKTNTIIMTPENALKFIDICENGDKNGKTLPPDRNIEYMLNSEYHNGHTIYYCDTNTLSMDWRKLDNARNVGIHITIFILKKKDKSKIKYAITRGLDTVLTMYNRVEENKYKKQSKKARWIVKPIVAIIGKKNLEKKIFNRYINSALNNKEGDYYLSKNNYKRSVDRYYDPAYFNGHDIVEIYGENFHAPKDVATYVRKIHGKYIEETIKVRDGDPSLFAVADTHINFEDIKPLLKTDLFGENSFEDYKKGTAINPDIRDYNNEVKNYWNILLRAEDRFKLYIHYKDKKAEIVKLAEAKDYVALEEILKDYDKAARKHARVGLGLCFDVDIYNIYCDLLREHKELAYLEKLEETIPEEHKREIEILY